MLHLIIEGYRQLIQMPVGVVLCQLHTSCSCERVINAKALNCFTKCSSQVLLCILMLTLERQTHSNMSWNERVAG